MPLLGCKHTDEARQKIKAARKKQIFSEETRKKISKIQTGRAIQRGRELRDWIETLEH